MTIITLTVVTVIVGLIIAVYCVLSSEELAETVPCEICGSQVPSNFWRDSFVNLTVEKLLSEIEKEDAAGRSTKIRCASRYVPV